MQHDARVAIFGTGKSDSTADIGYTFYSTNTGIGKTTASSAVSIRVKSSVSGLAALSGDIQILNNVYGKASVSGRGGWKVSSELLGRPEGLSYINGIAKSSSSGQIVRQGNVDINGLGSINLSLSDVSQKIASSYIFGVLAATAISELAPKEGKVNCFGRCHITTQSLIKYSQYSSERYPLIEKRVLFGPDTLGYIQSPDELY